MTPSYVEGNLFVSWNVKFLIMSLYTLYSVLSTVYLVFPVNKNNHWIFILFCNQASVDLHFILRTILEYINVNITRLICVNNTKSNLLLICWKTIIPLLKVLEVTENLFENCVPNKL